MDTASDIDAHSLHRATPAQLSCTARQRSLQSTLARSPLGSSLLPPRHASGPPPVMDAGDGNASVRHRNRCVLAMHAYPAPW